MAKMTKAAVFVEPARIVRNDKPISGVGPLVAPRMCQIQAAFSAKPREPP